MTGQAIRELRMSEAQWQRRVTDLCNVLHLKWHHETDSRRSKAGFPDLVIAGPGGHLFAELKSDVGTVKTPQHEWLFVLEMGGAEAYVWRPADWPAVEARLRELALLPREAA